MQTFLLLSFLQIKKLRSKGIKYLGSLAPEPLPLATTWCCPTTLPPNREGSTADAALELGLSGFESSSTAVLYFHVRPFCVPVLGFL